MGSSIDLTELFDKLGVKMETFAFISTLINSVKQILLIISIVVICTNGANNIDNCQRIAKNADCSVGRSGRLTWGEIYHFLLNEALKNGRITADELGIVSSKTIISGDEWLNELPLTEETLL